VGYKHFVPPGRRRWIGFRDEERIGFRDEENEFDFRNEEDSWDEAERQNMSSTEPATKKPQLLYTLFCDDVRLEAGNKLSFMGVFQNIMVQQLPVSLIKFAVVNHWQGQGSYLSEVRILTPDRKHPVVVSQPTRFEIAAGGFADNISFFVNVTFPTAGRYVVQTLIDSNLFQEQVLTVSDVTEAELLGTSEAVN